MFESQETGAIKAPIPYDNGRNITDPNVTRNERITAAKITRLRKSVFDTTSGKKLSLSLFWSCFVDNEILCRDECSLGLLQTIGKGVVKVFDL